MCVHDDAVSAPLHEPVMSALDVAGCAHAGLWLQGHWDSLRWRVTKKWLRFMSGNGGQRGSTNRISTAMPIGAPTNSSSGAVPLGPSGPLGAWEQVRGTGASPRPPRTSS